MTCNNPGWMIRRWLGCRCTALSVALLLLAVAGSQARGAVRVGVEATADFVCPQAYAGSPDGSASLAWSHTLHVPGATYLALHFAKFELADGDYLFVSDGRGKSSYHLTGRGKMDAGTFWAEHVKGDTVILQLVVQSPTGGAGFLIDTYAIGVAPWSPVDPVPATEYHAELAPASPVPGKLGKEDDRAVEAICDLDDKVNAACLKNANPTAYERSRPVARLLINGVNLCTGWLISPSNHLITNEHCIQSAADALNTDYEFMAEAPNCSDNNCQLCFPGQVYSGATLIQTSAQLDYALVQFQAGNPAASYGFLQVDNRPAVAGELIYIPQHPSGMAKEIAYYSTHASDLGGRSRISTVTAPPCSGTDYSDVGYYADTEGGSSGSPVIAAESHRVIALHHCAACPNRAVPISLVCEDLPAGLCNVSRGELRFNQPSYTCSTEAELQLVDTDLAGYGFFAATITTTGGDREIIGLFESSLGSGVFVAAASIVTGPPFPGDLLLQVQEGEQIQCLYQDADDGTGQPVQVVAEADIDCTSPVISEVHVLSLSGTSAVIGFGTDEPARGSIRHGSQCASLNTTTRGTDRTSDHEILLRGLTPFTTYAFQVSAVDDAGNSSSTGTACYSFTTTRDADDYFTEIFTNDNDLAGRSLTLTPDGSPEFYQACITPISSLPAPYDQATEIGLTDDSYTPIATHALLYGAGYDTLFIGSNGYITFRQGDSTFTETTGVHFSLPRIAAAFDDLDPSRGGGVFWERLADRGVVTWDAVPQFGATDNNTFQVELFDDGRIRISWLSLGMADGLFGISAGDGLPANFVETDLSGQSVCPPIDPLIVTPTATFMARGPVGGPFSPQCADFEVLSIGPDIAWTADADADCLVLNPAAGTSPSILQACLAPAADALPAGWYSGEIHIENTASGFTAVRTAALDICQPPEPVALLAPEDGATAEPLNVQFAWEPLGLPTESIQCESFGGRVDSWTGRNRMRGNVYTFPAPVDLNDIGIWLNFAGPAELHFYVLASTTPAGPYSPVFHRAVSAQGIGEAVYHSGPIDLNLEGGIHYAIGAAWADDDLRYYRAPAELPRDSQLARVESWLVLDQAPPYAGAVTPPLAGTSAEYALELCLGPAFSYDVYLGTTPQDLNPICLDTAAAECASPVPLKSDTDYFWKVVATDRCGTSVSPVRSFHTAIPTGPRIVSAASRRAHGPAGLIDRDLLAFGPSVCPAVEPRGGGPEQFIIQFDRPMLAVGGPDPADIRLTASEGTALVEGVSLVGDTITAQLAGPLPNSVLSIDFPGLRDFNGLPVDERLCVALLPGDVDGNCSVNIFDLQAVRAGMTQPASPANFLLDVQSNGQVNIFDLLLVRARLNTHLKGIVCP